MNTIHWLTGIVLDKQPLNGLFLLCLNVLDVTETGEAVYYKTHKNCHETEHQLYTMHQD